ncbi:MAG: ATP-binding protein [Eubacterium sp.]|nr:ATP-binding protein [Eubacterium sp.]
MNHDLLKQVIFDQHEVIRSFQIVPRRYHFEPNGNYVLVGLRRAGKSTLLYDIVQKLTAGGVDWKRIIYINFEDDRLAEFSMGDFNDIVEVQSELSHEKGYFFFDEIQNIEGWEKFARRMADARERVYITGSNARMLSREINAALGGRYLTKYISPYDFREYLTAIEIDPEQAYSTKARGRIQGAFAEYFHFGGFPEALLFQSKRDYISSIYQKILLGDIAARNNIRNENALRILIKKIAETVTDPMSYTKLSGILRAIGIRISKDTLIDYVGYAVNSYLIFTIQNFTSAFADREGTPKYYFSDNGLLNLFLVNKDALLLENMVAIVLKQQYGEDFYYYKSENSSIDLDFYIPDAGMAVQAAYSIAGTAREREIRALINLNKKEKGIKKSVIVTYEEEELIQTNEIEIQVIPITKFLLTFSGQKTA